MDHQNLERTGVYIGIASQEYMLLSKSLLPTTPFTATGSVLSVASGRISYSFGLQGPAMSVDTACSSSLVAAHLASTSLASGSTLNAIVSGVHLLLDPGATLAFGISGMLKI